MSRQVAGQALRADPYRADLDAALRALAGAIDIQFLDAAIRPHMAVPDVAEAGQPVLAGIAVAVVDVVVLTFEDHDGAVRAAMAMQDRPRAVAGQAVPLRVGMAVVEILLALVFHNYSAAVRSAMVMLDDPHARQPMATHVGVTVPLDLLDVDPGRPVGIRPDGRCDGRTLQSCRRGDQCGGSKNMS